MSNGALFMAENAGAESAPVVAGARIVDVDVIRGAALFGVLMMNLVEGFRVPYPLHFHLPPNPGFLHRAVTDVLAVLLARKAMTLFSLLFGVGMCIFYERACARGPGARALLARRLLVLLAFGVSHIVLLWNGDVLTSYAISGLLTLPFIRLRPAALWTMAVALIGGRAFIFWIWPTILPPSGGANAEHYRQALEMYGTGSYLDIVRFRASELVNFMLRFQLLEVPTEVSNFLIGIAIWRAGIVRHAARHRRTLFVVALIGISLGTGFTILTLVPSVMALVARPEGLAFLAVRNVMIRAFALGYGALFLWLLQRPGARAVLLRIAPIGQMAFTNYLSHSILFTTLFYGYAFGLLTRLGVAEAALLGIAVYIGQGILSTVWLRHFQFGPLEWAWRCLTYGKLWPMRR